MLRNEAPLKVGVRPFEGDETPEPRVKGKRQSQAVSGLGQERVRSKGCQNVFSNGSARSIKGNGDRNFEEWHRVGFEIQTGKNGERPQAANVCHVLSIEVQPRAAPTGRL
jgi:cold shock CspA family protein